MPAHFVRHILSAVVSIAAWASPGFSFSQQIPQLDLPQIELRAGMHRIVAQVASRPIERQIGLMRRDSMLPFEGMLFVFEHPGVQCFWMKDTTLPLTAAFLADDGAIVNLVDISRWMKIRTAPAPRCALCWRCTKAGLPAKG